MGISKQTIIRTALFFLLLVVMDIFYFIMIVELRKFDLVGQDAAVGYVATGVAANIAAIRAWWKNNSFSPEAIKADSFMYEQRGLQMIEDGLMDNIQREEEYAAEKEQEAE